MKQYSIYLIIGPQSSGKSTFLSQLLKQAASCKTINRKQILDDVNNVVNQSYLKSILEPLAQLTLIEFRDINELYAFDVKCLDIEKAYIFKQLKTKLIEKINSQEFDNYFLKLCFQKYAELTIPMIKNSDIILDEMLIDSEESYMLFKSYFPKESNIKLVVLYNNLDEILVKNLCRNQKFIKQLKQIGDFKETAKIIKARELESGQSASSFRAVEKIPNEYQKYFKFNVPKPPQPILDELSAEEINKMLDNINIASKASKDQLGSFTFFNNLSSSYLNKQNTIAKIIGAAKQVYITCNLKYDYLVRACDINSFPIKPIQLSVGSILQKLQRNIDITDEEMAQSSFGLGSFTANLLRQRAKVQAPKRIN